MRVGGTLASAGWVGTGGSGHGAGVMAWPSIAAERFKRIERTDGLDGGTGERRAGAKKFSHNGVVGKHSILLLFSPIISTEKFTDAPHPLRFLSPTSTKNPAQSVPSFARRLPLEPVPDGFAPVKKTALPAFARSCRPQRVMPERGWVCPERGNVPGLNLERAISPWSTKFQCVGKTGAAVAKPEGEGNHSFRKKPLWKRRTP